MGRTEPIRAGAFTFALGAIAALSLTVAPSLAAQDGGVLTDEQQAWLDDRDRTILLGTDDTYRPSVFFDASVDGHAVTDVIGEELPGVDVVRVQTEVDGLRAPSTGEVDALNRWIRLGPPDETESPAVLYAVAVVALLSALIAIAVIGWNRTLRRRVDDRTSELRTELEEHERTEAQRSLLELAIAQAAEIVVVAHADWSVRYLNPAFERVSGRPAVDMIGMPLDDAFAAEPGRDTLGDVHLGLERDGGWSGRVALRTRGAGPLPVEGSFASFILPSGAQGGFVGTLRDASHEERLQAELRRSERLKAVGTLAAGIAHDFNNLLTPILGSAELLTMTDDPELRVRYARSIQDAARRAGDLVQQVRSFGHTDDVETTRCDLGIVVTEAVELMRSTSPDDVEFDVRVSEPAITVLAEASQLHQVVMNLLANGVQAMDDGGGTLTVTLERADPGRAELVVTDTGTGIDDVTRARLFEPYFSTRRESGGTGLGLFTVAGIIRSLGGTVVVESAPGEGTSVVVVVPTADEVAEPGGRAGDRRERTRAGGRVLAVDDDEAVLEVLSSMLDRSGYDVTPCSSGVAALELIDEGRPFDLLLTDLGLPAMRGDELARRVQVRRPGLPVVMLTGHYDTETLADDWSVLSKPLQMSTLDEAVAAAIRNGRSARL